MYLCNTFCRKHVAYSSISSCGFTHFTCVFTYIATCGLTQPRNQFSKTIYTVRTCVFTYIATCGLTQPSRVLSCNTFSKACMNLTRDTTRRRLVSSHAKSADFAQQILAWCPCMYFITRVVPAHEQVTFAVCEAYTWAGHTASIKSCKRILLISSLY